MDNFSINCLKEANLTHSKELADILGKNWNEEEIRYAYQIVIQKLLKTHKFETLKALIDLDGKTTLSLIDDKFYLFEFIDIYYHEIYATEGLMFLIVYEMNKTLSKLTH